jgi:hypothetical protein
MPLTDRRPPRVGGSGEAGRGVLRLPGDHRMLAVRSTNVEGVHLKTVRLTRTLGESPSQSRLHT